MGGVVEVVRASHECPTHAMKLHEWGTRQSKCNGKGKPMPV
jgi:hypothetical protein